MRRQCWRKELESAEKSEKKKKKRKIVNEDVTYRKVKLETWRREAGLGVRKNTERILVTKNVKL